MGVIVRVMKRNICQVLTMDRLEIQTLTDETYTQYERDERKRLGKDPLEIGYDDGDGEDEETLRTMTKRRQKRARNPTLWKHQPKDGRGQMVSRKLASLVQSRTIGRVQP